MSYVFGGDTGMSYEQLQQRRKMAEQLRAQNSRTPRNVGEGLHSIARALVARGVDRQNTAREKEMRADMARQYEGIVGALTGNAGGSYGGSYSAAPQDPAQAMGLDMGSYETKPRETAEVPFVPVDPGADDMTWKAMASGAGGLDMGRDDMSKYRDAIASIESDGSGGYQAVGPTHPKLGRALGRYQVMEANLPQWSQEALGRQVSAQEFLANPDIQDAIFDHKFGGYVDKFGDEGAAQAWFAGPGGVGKMGRKDSLGTSVADYTQKFSGALGGTQGGGVRTANAGVDPSLVQMATLLSNPMLPEGQKAVLGALLERQLQQADPMRQLDMQYKQAQLEQLQNPAPDLPSSVEEYNFAKQQGFEGTYEDWTQAKAKAGASNVSVTTGSGEKDRYIYGSDAGLPQGWRLDRETGEASVIPSGPVAVEQQQAEAQAKSKDAQKDASTSLVLDEISLARDFIKEQTFFSPTTGITGSLLSNIDSTDAGALKNRLTTIKANIGFDKLQAMRDASPTGGALGQVSEFENRLLQAVYGSLEQAQSAEELLYNLDRLENIYKRIVHEGIGDDEARDLYKQVVGGEKPEAKRLKFNPETGELE